LGLMCGWLRIRNLDICVILNNLFDKPLFVKENIGFTL